MTFTKSKRAYRRLNYRHLTINGRRSSCSVVLSVLALDFFCSGMNLSAQQDVFSEVLIKFQTEGVHLSLAVAERRRWKLTARKLLCARHDEPYGDNSRSFRIKATLRGDFPAWLGLLSLGERMERLSSHLAAQRDICVLSYRRHEAVNTIYCIYHHTNSLFLHVWTHCTTFISLETLSCSL